MRRASKRRRADERQPQHEPQPQPQQRLSIITWNVDGLRALLRSPDGEAALRKLLIAEPLVLCLLEHKLQGDGAHGDSLEARQKLEAIASEFEYTATWTFSPRRGFDGLVALVRRHEIVRAAPFEPPLVAAEVARERRLLCLECEALHVLLVYAPNSGRPGRLEFRCDRWEPALRRLLDELRRDGKPVLYQGDLNVAHVRDLDAWGSTDAQFGGYKASGRTREEQAAMSVLLDECGLMDGFRHFHPRERSATCWAQKKTGSPNQREHWKRYDYALASRALVDGGADGVRLVDVRHLHDAFEGGRPDHLPVEAVLAVSARRDDSVTKRRTG